MDRIREFILKNTPYCDKLRHNFIGTLAYILTLFLSLKFGLKPWHASAITLVGTIVWEYLQKVNGGENSLKEQALDIFWGNINSILITIIISK